MGLLSIGIFHLQLTSASLVCAEPPAEAAAVVTAAQAKIEGAAIQPQKWEDYLNPPASSMTERAVKIQKAQEFLNSFKDYVFLSEGQRLQIQVDPDNNQFSIAEPEVQTTDAHITRHSSSDTRYLSVVENLPSGFVIQLPMELDTVQIRDAIRTLDPNNTMDPKDISIYEVFEKIADGDHATIRGRRLLANRKTGLSFPLEDQNLKRSRVAEAKLEAEKKSGDWKNASVPPFMILADDIAKNFLVPKKIVRIPVPHWLAKIFKINSEYYFDYDKGEMSQPAQVQAMRVFLSDLPKSMDPQTLENFLTTEQTPQIAALAQQKKALAEVIRNFDEELKKVKDKFALIKDTEKILSTAQTAALTRLTRAQSEIARAEGNHNYARRDLTEVIEDLHFSFLTPKLPDDSWSTVLNYAEVKYRNLLLEQEDEQRILQEKTGFWNGWFGGTSRAAKNANETLNELNSASMKIESLKKLGKAWDNSLKELREAKIKREQVFKEYNDSSVRIPELEKNIISPLKEREASLVKEKQQMEGERQSTEESLKRFTSAHTNDIRVKLEDLIQKGQPVIDGHRVPIVLTPHKATSELFQRIWPREPLQIFEIAVMHRYLGTEEARYWIGMTNNPKADKINVRILSRGRLGFEAAGMFYDKDLFKRNSDQPTLSFQDYAEHLALGFARAQAATPERKSVFELESFPQMISTLKRMGYIDESTDLNSLKAQAAYFPPLTSKHLHGGNAVGGVFLDDGDHFFDQGLKEEFKGVVSDREFGDKTLFSQLPSEYWNQFPDMIFHELVHILDKNKVLKAESQTKNPKDTNTLDKEFEDKGFAEAIQILKASNTYKTHLSNYKNRESTRMWVPDYRALLKMKNPQMTEEDIQKEIDAKVVAEFEKDNYDSDFSRIKYSVRSLYHYLNDPMEQVAWKAQISFLKNERKMSLPEIMDHLQNMFSSDQDMDFYYTYWIERWYSET